MLESDITIIGGGMVGLAIAERLAGRAKNAILLEKNRSPGEETSSRNSEVIHSGIYYQKNSLKSELCVKGRDMLYKICEEQDIKHSRTGKLIVATNKEDTGKLEKLFRKGKDNGLTDLEMLSQAEIKKIEPEINAVSAIYSPSAGILDTHCLIKYFESKAKENGVCIAYGCEVISITKTIHGYELDVKDADGDRIILFTKVLINSAGLNSDKIAGMVGINIDKAKYKINYCKGEYFRVSNRKNEKIARLVYPVPGKDSGLGIHATKDLQGMLKLGPNAFYVKDINYTVDESHKKEFYDSAKTFLPFIEMEDLSADMAGIRPRTYTEMEEERDFIIEHEEGKGLEGFVNLIGIESPGLTASPAIAEHVYNLIKKII